MSDWLKLVEQRDHAGNLTDLALALDAIEDNGCDCPEDQHGACLACLCERALHGQWARWAALREWLVGQRELCVDDRDCGDPNVVLARMAALEREEGGR